MTRVELVAKLSTIINKAVEAMTDINVPISKREFISSIEYNGLAYPIEFYCIRVNDGGYRVSIFIHDKEVYSINYGVRLVGVRQRNRIITAIVRSIAD